MSQSRSTSGKGASNTPRPRPRTSPTRSSGGSSRNRAPGTQTRSRAGGERRPAAKRPAREPRRGPNRALRIIGLVAAALFIAALVTAGIIYMTMSASLPDPNAALARGRDQTTVITDRRGRVIAKLFAEQNRSDKSLSAIPLTLQHAVISTEDQRFYEHAGVDPLGIARAVLADVVLRRRAQGGSTITQQYVKQAFVGDERSIKRKVMEAMLAQRVEKRYTKNQILELYLNTIYFGHGAYGVESASQVYFGKPVGKLSIPEAAMIAGVIKSPGRYSPYLNPVDAKQRRDTVLAQMRDQNYITQQEYDAAVASPIKTVGLNSASEQAPYFVEWVKTQLAYRFDQDQLYRGGLVIKTTLDLDAQHAAEDAISSTLNRKGDPSAALVAIKPGTGEVLAMVGGRDFKTQQFNAAVQGAGRQPGSSFKPFVLATALANGVSPEQTFSSGPVKLSVGNQVWSVTGAEGGKRGPMRLRVATEHSVNSVFAQLILKVGPKKVVETAEKMGLHKGIAPVPAIALGGLADGVTPLEMADAYATLAAGGQHATPYGVTQVTGPGGKVLFSVKPKTDTALDPAVAYLTTDILTGVIKRGTGTAAAIGRPAAGKTGTTQQNRDAWFVGYTPQLAAAVWMGYPEAQRAMVNIHGRTVYGGLFPARMWQAFMRAALAKEPAVDFARPPGLKHATICLDTGMAATAYCPHTASALFLDSTNLASCTLHVAPKEVTVPNLVGMTKEAALLALEKFKLVPKVVEKDTSGVAAGIVAYQTPKAGSIATSQTVVTLTVSNGGVTNTPPVPAFTMGTTAKPGETVSIDGSPSKDDGKIVKWYWEFGDGATGNGPKISHAWTDPGTFEVTLWVTDDKNQQASLTKSIKIQ